MTKTDVKIIHLPVYWPDGDVTEDKVIEITKGLEEYISKGYEIINSQTICGPEIGEIVYILKKVVVKD